MFVNMKMIGNKKIELIIIIIFISVVLPNLPYLFTDTLWHDDGLWYYRASEGLPLHHWSWLAEMFGAIDVYRYYLYSYSMVYLGLPITRGLFTIIMALTSIFLYFVYRNIFGFDNKVSVISAVIPNILPSLIGIPVGLTASYAMWALLPILACLLMINKLFSHEGFKSFASLFFAFALFFLGVNLGAGAGLFLIPCVLYIFLMYYPVRKRIAILYSSPFLFYGLWMIYRYLQHGQRSPVNIAWHVIYDRVITFFNMSSFLPFNKYFSAYITIGLMVLGFIGLLIMHNSIVRKPKQFSYSLKTYRLFIACWPLCWMISNGLAYIGYSATFRYYDYAYIFNFGAVLLQAAGIVFLSFLIAHFIVSEKKQKTLCISVVVIGILFYTGYQRIQYKSEEYGRKPAMEFTSKVLRDNMNPYSFPESAQIVVLDMRSVQTGNLRVPHRGNLRSNTGYLRYLLDRNDVNGLIGPDKYPNDVFADCNSWFDVMCGFEKNRPIAAFRVNGDTLVPVEYMFQITAADQKVLPRLNWTLYNISETHYLPLELASGEGLNAFSYLLDSEAFGEIKLENIAFGPPAIYDDFVDVQLAAYLSELEGLLNEELNFGNYFTLRNAFITETDDSLWVLNLLIKIDKVPKNARFQLGYEFGIPETEGKYLPWDHILRDQISLWDFVIEGDNILFRKPLMDRNHFTNDIIINFGIIDMGKLPREYLVVQGGLLDGDVNVPLQLRPSTKIHSHF